MKPTTSKTSHTPGPWKDNALPKDVTTPRADRLACAVWSADSKKFICTTRSKPTTSGFYADEEEAAANCRLIAAAPELLAALESILKALADKKQNGCMSLEYWTSPAVITAKEAIRQAKGGAL